MNIGIDLRVIGLGCSGIPNYVRNILNNLQLLDKKNKYYLFGSSKIEYQINNPNWKIVPVERSVPAIIFTQLIYPFILNRYKIDIFCSFDFICPLFLLNKTKRVTVVHDLTYIRFPKTMEFKVCYE